MDKRIVELALAILVHFEKDTVLSWSWSTTPGCINWTGGLIYRILIWLAVPLLTILAARFPKLGASLMTWLEPFTKALPRRDLNLTFMNS